ncbi:MAG: hypothetical protein JXB45_06305 [Candidatus Krumholzibacteriota bacterium]|nr:hypothetical protein [Candidatus Krumholzibacteriota bacterium]
MGGVARRATALNNLRSRDPDLLLLSAGDFYARSGIAEMYRSRFLSSLMVEMGYDAVALGEKELSFGLRSIREDAEAGLPVICANLYQDGKRIFPPAVITKVHGLKIGIFALLQETPPLQEEYEIRDPGEEGRAVLRELEKEKCDLTILLAHLRKSRLKSIIDSLPGLDMVIRGHTERGVRPSNDCADTLGGSFEDRGIPVLFAGDKGKALGKATVLPDPSGKITIIDTTLIYLNKGMGEDPEIALKLKQFGEQEGIRVREMQLSEFLSRDYVTGKIRERYLGMETCWRCHARLADEFTESGHFRAFARLSLAGEESNRECLACHTTGFGIFSGYDPEAEKKGGVNLRGVQCEACHGPGTKHARDGTYRVSARRSCLRCHTARRSPRFDFETWIKRFGHSVVADSAAAAADRE